MKRYLGFFGLVFVLGMVSSVFALDPILVGNFEDGPDTSFTPPRYDHWFESGLTMDDVTTPQVTVTRGTYSLKCTDADGGWGGAIELPLFVMGNDASNPWIQALLSPGAVFAVDATAFASDIVPGWCEIGFARNTAAPSGGWDRYMWQGMTLDGLPHRYAFTIDEATRNAIIAAYGGWGANIGLCINTGTGSATIYVDNVWIYPEGLIDEFSPYSPSVDQEFNANPLFVDAILRWKAGADPNEDYEVNPLIVDEYVFMNHGTETDPNLYYIGSTGEDPGLTDPNSQFGPLLLPINSTFGWAVVEATEGNEQTFTVDVSTLDDADPNNIIGPIWHFNTLSTLPTIATQPVSIRIPLGGTADPAFTVAVQSATPPSYQWYSSVDGTRDPVDEGGVDPKIGVASGGETASMKISNASAGYQRYFYCKVWNAATVSGGGAFDDVYSNVVTCVVERKVAEYLFNNSFADTGSNIPADLHPGTGMNSPAFSSTDKVEGSYSLSLDGISQYVDLGAAAYPKAALADAGGIGGGLEEGTVACWIKLDSIPTVDGTSRFAAILSSINAGWPSTQFEFGVESNAAAEYTNTRTFVIGDTVQSAWVSWRPTWVENFNMAGDGNWHMLAVIWPVPVDQTQQIQVFVDGSLIATGNITADTFSVWENNMLIGAANPGGSGVTRYFDGLIDNLRVYNYALAPEVIAQEYFNITGDPGCIYLDFTGSNLNTDNTGTSYCRVDIADFAVFAQSWLADGFYP